MSRATAAAGLSSATAMRGDTPTMGDGAWIPLALGIGPFGADLAELLTQQGRAALLPSEADLANLPFDTKPHLLIVCTWREDRALTARIDDWSHRTSTPWYPVVLEDLVLRFGPFIAPGVTACYGCFAARDEAESILGRLDDDVHAVLARSPELGPRGHAACHLQFAAAVLPRLIASDASATTSTIRRLHLVSGALFTKRHLRIHGCQRCTETQPVRTQSVAFGIELPQESR